MNTTIRSFPAHKPTVYMQKVEDKPAESKKPEKVNKQVHKKIIGGDAMKALALMLLLWTLSAFPQPKEPPRGERCVICGMDVNIDPKLTSQAKLRDGSYRYAESPKHILKYYLENREKVAELWVKDYKSGRWIEGTKAFYVPIKEGPMGYDLVPFRSRLDAQEFAKSPRSAKNKVYQLKEIDKVFIEHLDMGHVH